MAEEEYGSHLACIMLHRRISSWLTFLLWKLGYPSRLTSGISTLRGELGDNILWYCVHGSFLSQGDHGEEEYP